MMPGSFTKTLKKWRDSRKRIPIVWSHKTDSPDTVIGSADPNEVRETTSGLQVDGVLDIHESSLAKRAWQLLKSGAVSGWSFGYVVKDQKRGRDGVNEIFEVELLELGPTVSPANEATATLGVKEFADEFDEIAKALAAGVSPPDSPHVGVKGMSDEELSDYFNEYRPKKKSTAPIRVFRVKC
jgi:HK97 family phage prohead protease